MHAALPGLVAAALFAGAVATAVMDLWSLLLRHAFGITGLDWAMVGRWVGHWFHGRFVHEHIALAAPVRGERALGWGVHYATGTVFAASLLMVMGPQWARHPTLPPCLAAGWLTLAFPFFAMQPALGLGFAAARVPRPGRARLKSLVTHTVFGFGLYLALRVGAGLWPAA